MTNASMTFGRPNQRAFALPSLGFSTLLSGLYSSVTAQLATSAQRLDSWLQGSDNDQPRNAEELFALADRMAATQPGYAADLRAAALRSQGLDAH